MSCSIVIPTTRSSAAPTAHISASRIRHALAGRAPLPDPDQTALGDYLRLLSDGTVVGIRASGPVLVPKIRRRLKAEVPYTEVALARGPRAALALLAVGWLATLVCFWFWWMQPENREGLVGFVLNSLLVLYATLLPTYFVIAGNRMRRIAREVSVPELRVAMVVTKAPSEPWPVARETLAAMLEQEFPYPYDVWLADEHPSDVTRAWCDERGIRISTRQGDPRYQRPEWPRRSRCKEGNLAYFYDHFGYANYDVVAQLDVDHVPYPTYLREMVRPFSDPAVGYVGAPSVCDANASDSWTVRGRLYEESLFHGAQQMGALIQGSPSCIGSHYAVRTAAIREIGGIGPELAEDFSTSYLLNVAGWRGAFAVDAEAHGEGPRTFAAMTTQEFQWARSLSNLLFGVVWRSLGRLPFLLALEFLFRCGFDLLIAAITASGVALFAVSCITGVPFVSVNLLVFIGFSLLLTAWLIGMKALLRGQRLCRPHSVPLMSWEGMLYLYTRWPYIVMGVIASIADRLVPRHIHFKVTPKGDGAPEPLRVTLMLPFIVVAGGLTLCAQTGMSHPAVVGYVGLALLTACVNLLLVLVVSALHARDARARFGIDYDASHALVRGPVVLAALVAVPTALDLIAYLVQLIPLLEMVHS